MISVHKPEAEKKAPTQIDQKSIAAGARSETNCRKISH